MPWNSLAADENFPHKKKLSKNPRRASEFISKVSRKRMKIKFSFSEDLIK